MVTHIDGRTGTPTEFCVAKRAAHQSRLLTSARSQALEAGVRDRPRGYRRSAKFAVVVVLAVTETVAVLEA